MPSMHGTQQLPSPVWAPRRSRLLVYASPLACDASSTRKSAPRPSGLLNLGVEASRATLTSIMRGPTAGAPAESAASARCHPAAALAGAGEAAAASDAAHSWCDALEAAASSRRQRASRAQSPCARQAMPGAAGPIKVNELWIPQLRAESAVVGGRQGSGRHPRCGGAAAAVELVQEAVCAGQQAEAEPAAQMCKSDMGGTTNKHEQFI